MVHCNSSLCFTSSKSSYRIIPLAGKLQKELSSRDVRANDIARDLLENGVEWIKDLTGFTDKQIATRLSQVRCALSKLWQRCRPCCGELVR